MMAQDNEVFVGTTSYIKNFFLRDPATGLALTGKTHSDCTGTRCLNGGTEVALSFSGGSPGDSYTSGKIVPIGNGKYAWHVPNAMFTTLGSSLAEIRITGGITVTFDFTVVSLNRNNAVNGGMSALDVVETWVQRLAVVQLGAISNAGTDMEQYTISALGVTVTFADLDSSGNRGITVYS